MGTEKFIQQELDYIHFNPCKAKMAELPAQYEHSSAKYYLQVNKAFILLQTLWS
jgi:hypothetical protein